MLRVKTVTKALSLLDLFLETPGRQSLGALAESAGLDKATARRMLVAMCDYGLVEQDGASRLYALGPRVLPLARAREADRPLLSVVDPEVRAVAAALGETCHFSLPAHGALSVLCVAEADRPIRVHVREGSTLPLHTTGAGIAFLAASDDSVVERVLAGPMPAAVPGSYVTPAVVRAAVADARRLGYARTDQTFEADVTGTARVVRDGRGAVVGALGVAMPVHRMTPEVEAQTLARLEQAVDRLTSSL